MSVLACPVCGRGVNAAAGRCPECGADPHLPADAARAELEAADRERAERTATRPPADRDPYAPAWVVVLGGLLVGVLGLFAMLVNIHEDSRYSSFAHLVNLVGMLVMFAAAAIAADDARLCRRLILAGFTLGLLGAGYNLYVA